MAKYKNESVKVVFNKIDKGIWESKKWKAKQVAKKILIAIWTVIVFPFVLLRMFITNKTNPNE